MATKVRPISTLHNVLARKRRKFLLHRTRWEIVPSERKVLAGHVEENNNNVVVGEDGVDGNDVWRHDLTSSVDDTQGAIEYGVYYKNTKEIDSVCDYKMDPLGNSGYEFNSDGFVIQSTTNGHYHGDFFLETPPPLISFSTPQQQQQHSVSVLSSSHGPCCVCPCHQYPGTGNIVTQQFNPFGGTLRVICLPPPPPSSSYLSPSPVTPISTSQQQWVVEGDSVPR